VDKVRDIIIIGAGPIGLACGIAARNAGMKYLILEKGALVNSIYNYPLNMTFFSTSERLEIGNVPFIARQHKPGRDEALDYYRRVAFHQELNFKLYTPVTDIKKINAHYQVVTPAGDFLCRYVIIATGFYDTPQKLGIEGEDLPKVLHYYKEAHPFTGQKIAVIGAANSAVDAALETYRKGAQVSMIIRENKISDRVKYWVKPDIENRIAEGAIKAYFNSRLLRIGQNSVDIDTPEGILTIDNDFVLAMTGYRPDFALLRNAGIKINEENNMLPEYNSETMETNQEGIYLAGVVCGGLETHKWFIENSRVHADMIIRNIAAKHKS
jgi:thioredoxin reductase (NADPH)